MVNPQIELLYTEGCANAGPTGLLLREVVDGLLPGGEVRRVLVADAADAARLRFPGSPTIRVNGGDIEGDAVGGVGLS